MNKNSIIALILFGAFTLMIFIISCSPSSSSSSNSSNSTLFSLKNSSSTGLDFQNTITQTGELNVLRYNYFLNGGGVAVGDFNNDGLSDIFFTGNQVDDKLYLNKGNLKFEDISKKAKINVEKSNQKSWSTGVTTVDINHDGWLDIYVSKSGPFQGKAEKQNLLFVNNGDLTFTEQGTKYGVNDSGFSTQATFFDYDKDGDLDLYVLNHSYIFNATLSRYAEMNKDKKFVAGVSSNLYENKNGVFVKSTEGSGLMRHAFGLGVVASDYDNDSWVDLYATSDYDTPDYLFKNKREGKFEDVINSATKHISFYGMGCDIADINNDGHPEISVMDMTPPDQLRSKTLMASMDANRFHRMHEVYGFQYQYMINTLQLNHGNGKFSEVAQLAGVNKTDWSWTTLLADLDNDGYKDMFVTNGYLNDVMDNDFNNALKKRKAEVGGKFSNQEREEWLSKLPSQKLMNFVFKNEGHLKFKKMNDDWGMKELTFSNGAAYADFDNDGDLDVVINNINQPAYFYENHQNEKGNNYLQIQLKGIKKNPMGLNAKVKVYSGGKMQYQELTLTRGYQSACDNILHFGLGQNSSVDSVVVIWLDNFKQNVLSPKINQKLVVDRSLAKEKYWYPKTQSLFFEKTKMVDDFSHKHEENIYDDFVNELLLPHKNSRHGPFISVGDVNGDKLEDFFIGGAANKVATLYLQNSKGGFSPAPNQPWEPHRAAEDMGSLFFDYDQDGDLDLYVISGGNELKHDSPKLQDRLYKNNGNAVFTYVSNAIPGLRGSGSRVISADFNKDGKPDLFVGGRMKPMQYPYPSRSYIFIQNENGIFVDKTKQFAPSLAEIGIVTDAIAEDIDGDGNEDLIVVGEWMNIKIFKNTGQAFVEITPDNISSETGWWNTIEKGDFDNDGDIDFVVGNLGLNYKYKAKKDAPFQIYCNDFDKSGNLDIVLGYESESGTSFPVRGRECSSEQMPFIKEKFPTYKSFASATLEDVYGDELGKSYQLNATNFATSLLINEGNGAFKLVALPAESQISCTNAVIVEDFNSDNNLDLLLAGNLYASEVETPRNDAGVGALLLGNGDGTFEPKSVQESGFFANKDTKDLEMISLKNIGRSVLVANNDDVIEVFTLKKNIPSKPLK